MISKTEIERNLRSLDGLYRRARTTKHSLYFAKLAILELCGWIEMSMDDLVRRCAKRRCTQSRSLDYIEDKIKRTYGFYYNKHFQDMLVRLFGIITFEKVEAKVDAANLARLKSVLDTLKTIRNSEAHTFLKGQAIQLDAPSTTLTRFSQVYEGLRDFEEVIRRHKF